MEVPVFGIDELLDNLEFVPNLLVVDAEGEDERIIKGINFERFRPTVIEVEVNKAQEDGRRLTEYLGTNNYMLFTRIGSNAIYVDENAYKHNCFDEINAFYK